MRPVRFAARLRDGSRGGGGDQDLPAGAEVPAKVDWFPERAWGGRVWIPCSARSESEEGTLELFGHVSYVQPLGGEATDFAANADFTDILAADNPDWRIDLNDDVVGRWRGENGRAGAVTLVWGRPLGPRRHRRDRRARRRDRRPGGDLKERFTLIALDALEGYGDEIFMEAKLWSRRAQELASESLYA